MFVGPAYANETLRRDKHYSVTFAAQESAKQSPVMDFIRGGAVARFSVWASFVLHGIVRAASAGQAGGLSKYCARNQSGERNAVVPEREDR
jgi:hypothetical protein